MNLAIIESSLRHKILTHEEQIAFCVYHGECIWIIDWDEHFNLDYMQNIQAVCSDKDLMNHLPADKTVEEYRKEVILRYRDGITTLTDDLFPKYRNSKSAKTVSTELLREEFFAEDTGQYKNLSKQIETEISFNTPMQETFVQLRMRLFSLLPKFYINYDRKIFMHMVRGRFYESVILDGWWGAEGDFEHMIPTSHRYWVRNKDEDFWAITNFSNGQKVPEKVLGAAT